MKKILLMLALILTSKAFANDYVQRYGQCHLYADEQDYFNQARRLPFEFNLRFALSFHKESGELLASVFRADTETTNTAPSWAHEIVESIEDNISAQGSYSSDISLNFEISNEQLNALVLYLGSYRSIQNGHNFPAQCFSQVADGNEARYQVHTDSDNGLSYHFYLSCSTDGSSSSQPPHNQEPNPSPMPIPAPPKAYKCTYELNNRYGRSVGEYVGESEHSRSKACDEALGMCLYEVKQDQQEYCLFKE